MNRWGAEVEIYHIGIRIMDEIVKPLRDIQMDDAEYTCLKAIVFFDPSKTYYCKSVNLKYFIYYY